MAAMVEKAQDLVRFKNGLKNQTIRGDLETLKDLETALDKGGPVLEALLVRYLKSFKPIIGRLTQKNKKQPVKE